MGKGQPFQQMMLGKLDIHMKGNEVKTTITPDTKINSKLGRVVYVCNPSYTEDRDGRITI
jgi:hypothetical protein